MVEQLNLRNMKSINKIYFLLASVILMMGACIDPVDVTPTSSEGGLLEIETPGVYYVVGEDKPYTVEFKVFQGAVKTTQVKVFKSFHTVDTAGNALVSNEVLFKTIDISETVTHFVSFDVTFAELRDGLQIDGADLPATDAEFQIGDYWDLRFVSVTSDGEEHQNYAGAIVSVSTRFAGSYLASETVYLHPTAGSFYGEWDGMVKSVLSVDAITYKLQYIAYSYGGWDVEENTLYFQVNGDLSVTVLKEYDGNEILLWGTDPVATCDAGELPGIDCANTNFVVKDDVNGADEIHIAYGYIRDTGTRQFSEVLTKIVN